MPTCGSFFTSTRHSVSELKETSGDADYLGLVEAVTGQDSAYLAAAEEFGAALDRLARAYEFDAEKRRDLLQEIHFQLWRSFAKFDARCSVRTWVYRVAHHVAASYVIRERRRFATLVSLEELEKVPDKDAGPDTRLNLERLARLIQQLKPLDRQVIVSYLEDLDAESIAEITGLAPANVAVRIHRIKNVLARRFHEGGSDGK